MAEDVRDEGGHYEASYKERRARLQWDERALSSHSVRRASFGLEALLLTIVAVCHVPLLFVSLL